MAIVAILLLLHIRMGFDSLIVVALETISSVILLLGARRFAGSQSSKDLPTGPSSSPLFWNIWSFGCVIGVIAIPWIANPLAKQFGRGNGMEIVMLASLGWGSLSVA